ncbi:hypothetical protein GOP47_0014203 [Adiantum capillus-veneris]|uniref:IBH1-like N-terminal domain-containing protein n=1 Tax=Adiantum capillus-veneris TaxID=13818 RepID=A0A9D4UR01_ADICA|nr:hypothetical protein GOP47_0014203 [Adiantum capillus-veneris]
MGKLNAMDGAPSSSPTEDAVLSDGSPLPPKYTPWHSVLFGHASSGACLSSPCVSVSSEVDLMAVDGHSARMPLSPRDHSSSLAYYPNHADPYIPTSPPSVHAAVCTAAMSSSLSALMHVGEYALVSGNGVTDAENGFIDAEMPAPTSNSLTAEENVALGLTPDGVFLKQRAFACSYINTLLPALRRIHSQGLPISLDEKVSAVKLAADMSLAVAAGGNNAWSQALLREVASTSTCRSLLSSPQKEARRRKPARMLLRKIKSSNPSMYRPGARCPKAHALVRRRRKYDDTTMHGSASPLYMADLLARGSHGFDNALDCSPLSMEPRLAQLSCVKHRMPYGRSARSSYLRILRSTKCKRKPWSRKGATSVEDDEVSRTSSTAVINKEQIESLGGLVPGGLNMDVPRLLEEAADYILTLRMQVEALQSLSRIVSP